MQNLFNFPLPLSLLAKNVVKIGRRPVLHPINNGDNADKHENKNRDFSIDLHHHQTSSPDRNNFSSVSTPHYSYSLFLQNVTPSRISIMPNYSVANGKSKPTPHQGELFALVGQSVISGSQIKRFFGHSIFLDEKLCVILHILELKSNSFKNLLVF